MRSSIIIAFLVAAVSAAPAPSAQIDTRSCHEFRCAIALGPTVVTCVAAALQEELDPITDAACFASAANLGINKPTACAGCF